MNLRNQFRPATALIILLMLVGCGPKHYGYYLHTNADKEAKELALLVYAVNDFAVDIYSINNNDLRGVTKTSSQVPTYIELIPGKYIFGVGLSKGYGPCGRVDVHFKEPTLMYVEVEAGKVYMIQRRSKFDSAIMCDRLSNKIAVEFYLS